MSLHYDARLICKSNTIVTYPTKIYKKKRKNVLTVELLRDFSGLWSSIFDGETCDKNTKHKLALNRSGLCWFTLLFFNNSKVDEILIHILRMI